MEKIVQLSMARRPVPTRLDYVQYATRPDLVFVLDDYTPSPDAIATFYVKKPSGNEVYNLGTIVHNVVTVPVTAQTFAEVGRHECQLQITDTKTAVSYMIYVQVEKNIIEDSAIESTDEYSALVEMLQQASGLTGRIDGLETWKSDTVEPFISHMQWFENNIADNVDMNTQDISDLQNRLTEDESNITSIRTDLTTEQGKVTALEAWQSEVADYVIEEFDTTVSSAAGAFTTMTYHCRKWNSGRLEAEGYGNAGIQTPDGSFAGGVNYKILSVGLPTEFTSIDWASSDGSKYGTGLYWSSVRAFTLGADANAQVQFMTSASASISVNMYVIGKWK